MIHWENESTLTRSSIRSNIKPACWAWFSTSIESRGPGSLTAFFFGRAAEIAIVNRSMAFDVLAKVEDQTICFPGMKSQATPNNLSK